MAQFPRLAKQINHPGELAHPLNRYFGIVKMGTHHMQPIRCQEDVNRALTALLVQDPALQPLADRVGLVPLRLREPGFEGLARIVNSQQLSVASASAIWQRISALANPFQPDLIQALSDEELLSAGFSRPKLRTIRALSQACLDGLDVEALAQRPAAQARAALTAIHGIGPWTADIFLMFCAGHPDIFPVGDVALQNVARDILNLRKRPSEKHLARLVRRWLPHRSVAARLLWAYYGTQKAASGGNSVTSRLPI